MINLYDASFFSGLSGLQLNVPKSLFPESFQNASRLTFYSSLFNTIEINSSFYKIPQQATVAKWADSVIGNFQFTFKMNKEITHNHELDFNKELVVQFLKSIEAVKEKSGCILIQFPSSVGKGYIVKLNNLLNYIKEIQTLDWKIAVEFRNKSWYNEATFYVLNFYNAGLVIHDTPNSSTPRIKHETDFIYIRLHGPTGNYRDSYSGDFLKEYASNINEYIDEGKMVFMYFNNTIGDALNNLKTINGFIQNKIEVMK